MKYLYVANWKMNMNFSASIDFCTTNGAVLQQLSTVADIVICPSFVALAPCAAIFNNNNAIAYGAQDCSAHASGPYTGEISAESLAQIGVTYCIVGHSERRMYHGEVVRNIIKKIELLYENSIIPILCIGETQQDFLNKKTYITLAAQLEPVLASIAHINKKNSSLVIAYEPVWSIGTGIIPDHETVAAIFAWLVEYVRHYLPEYTVQLLYGGSVNQKNIVELKKISHINGFLIGGASIHGDEFAALIRT